MAIQKSSLRESLLGAMANVQCHNIKLLAKGFYLFPALNVIFPYYRSIVDKGRMVDCSLNTKYTANMTLTFYKSISSVIFVNENENENYQKRKNNDFVNEN